MLYDPELRTISDGDNTAYLTPQQGRIFEALAKRSGKAVSLDNLFEQQYDAVDIEPDFPLAVLRVQIFHIRRKAASAGLGRLIGSVWGSGYILRAPVEIAVPVDA